MAAGLRIPASGPTPGRTSPSARRARGVTGRLHVLEEFRRRVDHQHIGPGAEAGAIRFEAAVEIEELRVLTEGHGIDRRRLGIALALQLLRVAIGFREQHFALAIGIGADLLAFRRTDRTLLVGYPLAFRLH